MDKHIIFHAIGIAKEQEAISNKKRQLKHEEGNEYAANVYRIRADALRLYQKNLYDTLNKVVQKEKREKFLKPIKKANKKYVQTNSQKLF